MIWSDSQRYTRSQVARTTGDRRDDLLILASESSVRGIERLAGIVDGNAFEWPSLDPQAQRGFAQKPAAMGDAVRRDGGIWIPVATPGFAPRGSIARAGRSATQRSHAQATSQWRGPIQPHGNRPTELERFPDRNSHRAEPSSQLPVSRCGGAAHSGATDVGCSAQYVQRGTLSWGSFGARVASCRPHVSGRPDDARHSPSKLAQRDSQRTARVRAGPVDQTALAAGGQQESRRL